MTLQEKSRLNYLLGRMEGLAEGIPEQAVRMSLISTCEMLTELLEENEEGEREMVDINYGAEIEDYYEGSEDG